MISFRRAVFNILGKGQGLTELEEALIDGEVKRFAKDYKTATGKEPLPFLETVVLFANRLQSLGFEMPRVDRWFEDDMSLGRNAERQGIKYLRKERF